jgi:hypothetical protein
MRVRYRVKLDFRPTFTEDILLLYLKVRHCPLRRKQIHLILIRK